jgi:hypothetical protein
MSRPRVSDERRVVYTGFSLTPPTGDHRSEPDLEQVRRDRASLNSHVRRCQHDKTGAPLFSFDLCGSASLRSAVVEQPLRERSCHRRPAHHFPGFIDCPISGSIV